MYALLASLIGGIITVMNGINSLFSARVGNLAAVLCIHIVGLSSVTLVLLFRREGRERERRTPSLLPVRGRRCGCRNRLCLQSSPSLTIGASLSVALALLGQMLGSIAVDMMGFLGRQMSSSFAPQPARHRPCSGRSGNHGGKVFEPAVPAAIAFVPGIFRPCFPSFSIPSSPSR